MYRRSSGQTGLVVGPVLIEDLEGYQTQFTSTYTSRYPFLRSERIPVDVVIPTSIIFRLYLIPNGSILYQIGQKKNEKVLTQGLRKELGTGSTRYRYPGLIYVFVLNVCKELIEGILHIRLQMLSRELDIVSYSQNNKLSKEQKN